MAMTRVPEDDRPRSTRCVYFHKNGDPSFPSIRIPVNLKKYRTLDALLDDLTSRVDLPYGVRIVATAHGKHRVNNVNELEHLKR